MVDSGFSRSVLPHRSKSLIDRESRKIHEFFGGSQPFFRIPL